MLNINNIEEITSFVGTRKEIYNLISKYNPLAVIDYRQARVDINDEYYLIILKKVGINYKIRCIWKIGNANEQFYF